MGTISNYYSSVQKMLARMNATSLREFAALRDDEDRVRYVLNLQGANKILAVEPRYERKVDTEAKSHRELGNKLYTAKKFKQALECYNKAIACASWPPDIQQYQQTDLNHTGDEYDEARGQPETCSSDTVAPSSKSHACVELPLALGNRSATLYQLGYYNQCIADIDLALFIGFQPHLRYKLHDRKGRCLMEKGKYEEACMCFEDVITSLECAMLNSKQKTEVHKNCLKQIEACAMALSEGILKTNQSPDIAPDNLFLELVVFTPSQQLPNATEGVEIRYSQSQGRYAVTSRPLEIGEIVMSESPYASVLNPALWKKRCYHCFALLPIAPLPCQECKTIRYCSNKCRSESWTNCHKSECHYLGLLQSSGTGVLAHLALRVLLLANFNDVLKCTSNLKSKRGLLKGLFTNSKGVFLGGFVSLFNLLAHSTERDANEIFQFSILAVYLCNILYDSGFVDDNLRSIYEKQEQASADLDVIVGSVLLRFIQIIACNGIEITELSAGENLNKTNPETIGLALFPTVSLLNHSCNPLVEIIFFNNRCIAKTIQNIKEGGEINIDYGYIYYTTDRKHRQRCLQAQYHFLCGCIACTEKWQLKNRLPDGIPPLKCPNCGTRLVIGGQKNPLQNKCTGCGLVNNPIEIFEKLRESSMLCEKAIENGRAFAIQEAIPVLEQHITLLANHICEPYKEYTSCVSILKQCYRVLGNKHPELVETLQKLKSKGKFGK